MRFADYSESSTTPAPSLDLAPDEAVISTHYMWQLINYCFRSYDPNWDEEDPRSVKRVEMMAAVSGVVPRLDILGDDAFLFSSKSCRSCKRSERMNSWWTGSGICAVRIVWISSRSHRDHWISTSRQLQSSRPLRDLFSIQSCSSQHIVRGFRNSSASCCRLYIPSVVNHVVCVGR